MWCSPYYTFFHIMYRNIILEVIYVNDYYSNMLYRRRPGPFGRPPFGIRPGRPGQQGPSGPPPSFTPERRDEGPSLMAVDPRAIRRCTFRFVYLWLEDGREFWAYLVFVGPRSVSGYRWDKRRRRWVYFGTDIRNIKYFECY